MAPAPAHRIEGLDVARGFLLLAMVAVHVLPRHGTPAQGGLLQSWIGVFLISSGFVALSGYVISVRPRPGVPAKRRFVRAGDSALQLLLVMFAYGVLLSLFRHGLGVLGGGADECASRFGWTPPTRFADIGILLPIAIVQLFAPLGQTRERAALGALLALSMAWMLLPTLEVSSSGLLSDVFGVFARRSITPFYTVATFVALGLAGMILGKWPPRALLSGKSPPAASVSALLAAIVMSVPNWSSAVLDPFYYRGGAFVGTLATLLWWTLAVALLLRAFAAPLGSKPSIARRALALLGRNSLFAFVLHDFLLELNTYAASELGLPRGAWVVGAMVVVDAAILLGACYALERRSAVREAATAILLNRSRGRSRLYSGAFSLTGGLALVAVLAVYTGSALARPGAEQMIDDFEQPGGCPTWWNFGALTYRHQRPEDESERGRFLEVRGRAPGAFAHGIGVTLHREIGDRRTLELDVRGYGPGSGRVKIELGDDDNGNWVIEKDPELYIPLYDDRWVQEISVDWWGWRDIALPLASFRDDNPGRGNDAFDPARDLTSGGLIELQLLFAPGSSETDEIRIDLDNLRWAP